MENQRCLYCGRKIHHALRLDTKSFGQCCKSSYHRDKQPPSGPAPASVHCRVSISVARGFVVVTQIVARRPFLFACVTAPPSSAASLP